jgi:NADH:ubiquinone oxidoreductase subunit K
MHGKGTARAVGLLFITATVAGVLSVVLLDGRAAVATLLVVFMAAAIAMIPPVLFPVLRRHNEALALGYVVARTLEVVLLLPAAVNPELMKADLDPAQPVSAVFFCLGALILNYVLYRSRLVPRLISVWALVAVAPYVVAAVLVMFGQASSSSTVPALLMLPLAVNEMALALWLLIKGFRTTTA